MIEVELFTAASDKAAKQRQIRMRRWSVACLCGAVNNSG